MCDTLDIPRSTYYQSLCKTESNLYRENETLTEQIKAIHRESNKRYGADKTHRLLVKKGFQASIKRVQRLMQKAGIFSITKKKFRPQSNNKPVTERENLLEQDFSTTAPKQKWVGDITYIHTVKEGWCYLASVMDLYTKKIIGYSFARSMTTELVENALNNACETQSPKESLILHTDLGSQYTSDAFTEYAKSLSIKQSFSHKGCPYDNACIESFHAILKTEEVNHVRYLDYQSAKLAMFKYIEGWYNRKRIHGSIEYRTPQEQEDLFREMAS